MDESRWMYDQLAVLAPIMMAITAASPIYKGRLSDVDARWNVIAQSVVSLAATPILHNFNNSNTSELLSLSLLRMTGRLLSWVRLQKRISHRHKILISRERGFVVR